MTRFGDRLMSWLGRMAGAPQRELHDVRGLRVVVENSREDIRTEDVLARFDEAVALIEHHQPWRLAHMRRDIAQFAIVRYPCRGAFFPATRTCMTELTFLARRDITAAPVAASMLHEGMHARMHARGIDQWGPDLPRIERICRRAELDFGRALPPELGDPVVERALATLSMDDAEVAPNIDWEVAMRRQDAIDARRRPDA